ncbi:WD40 repeat-like protein [Abortiporus biennis]|nr:WD40 repeat-like protein [Abortiporus biennis]
MQSTITLPITTVQPDFSTVISEIYDGLIPDEAFWLSCYKSGEISIHGKVSASLDERDRTLVVLDGKGGISFERSNDHVYYATCDSLGISKVKVTVPRKVFTDPLPPSSAAGGQICAFDIAPDGSQFATGYEDGSIYIVPTSSPTPSNITTSKPHLNSITSLKYFPSSRVLLSTSLDFSLSIIPADLPNSAQTQAKKVSAARTFKGHSRSVTCSAIIARGRNILSGGKDGTLRLWDVSSGSQIRSMGVKGYTPILALSVGERGEGAFSQPPDGDEKVINTIDGREVETAEKIAFCSTQDGSIQAFDLGTKLSVFQFSPQSRSSPLQSIAYSATMNLLATGSGTGVVTIYDTRALNRPLTSFSRNGAAIEDIAFIRLGADGSGIAIATEDGLPYVAGVHPEGPSVYTELVGTDCEAIRCIRVRGDGNELWTAGDDGIVRKYEDITA